MTFWLNRFTYYFTKTFIKKIASLDALARAGWISDLIVAHEKY